MTLADALTLKAEDVVILAAVPECGLPARQFLITYAAPAGEYAAHVSGFRVGADGRLDHSNKLSRPLDGGRACMRAIKYWTKA